MCIMRCIFRAFFSLYHECAARMSIFENKDDGKNKSHNVWDWGLYWHIYHMMLCEKFKPIILHNGLKRNLKNSGIGMMQGSKGNVA